MTPANDMREALARVVVDQRRDADLVVNDILAVLREYGRDGWLDEYDDGDWKVWNFDKNDFDSKDYPNCTNHRVLVLPLPDQEPTDA